jgi:hypothetical protein
LGQGRQLGSHLRRWLDRDATGHASGVAVANVLIDALGADERLKGPVRDLGSQPLFLQALRQGGAAQRSSLAALHQQLTATYSPAVLTELLDLVEAVTGVALPQPKPHPANAAAPNTSTPASSTAPSSTAIAPTQDRGRTWAASPWIREWIRELRGLAPGIAAAAGAAPVLAWLGQELENLLLADWGWSAGVALAAGLGLLQALSLAPLRRLRRRWPLNAAEAQDPHDAWRWITAPWWHARGTEAAANLLLLLIVLGRSPLPLGEVVLRYGLTALAAQAPAALVAAHFGISRQWSGSAGPLGALIGLAAGMSLLQGRALAFELGPLTIPAWVLLLVYSALQLGWQLPRQNPDEQSQPWQRLLASTWSWGLLLGLGWALISWVEQQLPQSP